MKYLLLSVLFSISVYAQDYKNLDHGLICTFNDESFILLQSFNGDGHATQVTCKGFLQVIYSDKYSFRTNINDAVLLIDDKKHFSKMYLQKGLHKFSLSYQYTTPYLEWSNSATKLTIVPSDHFWRVKE